MPEKNNNFRVAKIEPARKTWFFERPDGSVFATEENEAWELLKYGNSGWRMRGIKPVGTSSGTIYRNAMLEAAKVVKVSHECSGDEFCNVCNDHEEKIKQIIRAGFDAELESAKGHFQMPANKDVIFREGTSPEAEVMVRKSMGL